MLRQSLEYTIKLKRGIKKIYIAIHTLTSCIICRQNGCGKRDLIRRWHCRSGLLEQKLWVGIQKAWFQAFVLLLFSRCVMMTMVIHLYEISISSLKSMITRLFTKTTVQVKCCVVCENTL